MPTYAYSCVACGFAKDEWLKVSAALPELTCPSCAKPTYRKQLTAPAFQLKGGGWYVTDFRQGNSAASKTAEADSASSVSNDSSAVAPVATPASASSAPTAPSTPATGGS